MRSIAYSLANLCLFLACAAEPRPLDSTFKSFNEQSPLQDYTMPSTDDANTGIIISDVIGRAQNIAIFSGLTRDIDAVSGRLEDAAQNATVLAPDNTVMKNLKRKPWEDPEDYNQFGAQAYEGASGSDRAHSNLERFVKSHIVPESPWEEGKRVKTLAGNEVWWESKNGQKTVSGCARGPCAYPHPFPHRQHIVSLMENFHQTILNGEVAELGKHTSSHNVFLHLTKSQLWRQVKVSPLSSAEQSASWSRKWRGFESRPHQHSFNSS